jgi:Fur family ferric uptake transcriptional regulator
MRMIRSALNEGGADGLTARNGMESRIERLCIERGLKMTGQRRVVARVLSDAGDHPDVEELYRRASALDQHISIATVYRTVRLFEEHGILERRDFGGGRARYEPSEDGPHYHLIDVETGKVIEFQDPEHERLMHAIAARLGFDVVSLRLELFGRRRGSAEPAHLEPGDTGPPEPMGSASGRDHDTPHDASAAGRDPQLHDPITGASR